jgi:hypothetical protein
MVLGSIDSEPLARQNIKVVGANGKDYSPHGRQEAEKEERTGLTFKGMLPVTYFLKTDPSSESFHPHPQNSTPSWGHASTHRPGRSIS